MLKGIETSFGLACLENYVEVTIAVNSHSSRRFLKEHGTLMAISCLSTVSVEWQESGVVTSAHNNKHTLQIFCFSRHYDTVRSSPSKLFSKTTIFCNYNNSAKSIPFKIWNSTIWSCFPLPDRKTTLTVDWKLLNNRG